MLDRATADSLVGSKQPQFNQTNLAIKGALGVGAMAKISTAAGHADDANQYDVGALGGLLNFGIDHFVDYEQTAGCTMDSSHVSF